MGLEAVRDRVGGEPIEVEGNQPLIPDYKMPERNYGHVDPARLPIAFRPTPEATLFEMIEPGFYHRSLLEDASGELPKNFEDAIALIGASLKDSPMIAKIMDVASWDDVPAEFVDCELGGEKLQGDRSSRAMEASTRVGDVVYDGADGKIVRHTSASLVGFAGEGELLLDDLGWSKAEEGKSEMGARKPHSSVVYYTIRTKRAALQVVK